MLHLRRNVAIGELWQLSQAGRLLAQHVVQDLLHPLVLQHLQVRRHRRRCRRGLLQLCRTVACGGGSSSILARHATMAHPIPLARWKPTVSRRYVLLHTNCCVNIEECCVQTARVARTEVCLPFAICWWTIVCVDNATPWSASIAAGSGGGSSCRTALSGTCMGSASSAAGGAIMGCGGAASSTTAACTTRQAELVTGHNQVGCRGRGMLFGKEQGRRLTLGHRDTCSRGSLRNWPFPGLRRGVRCIASAFLFNPEAGLCAAGLSGDAAAILSSSSFTSAAVNPAAPVPAVQILLFQLELIRHDEALIVPFLGAEQLLRSGLGQSLG